jgi:hypothetical protein
MSETNGHRPLDSDYWAQSLAAAIGMALVTKPFELSKAALRRALQDFSKSETCNAELRDYLRGKLKGER